MLLQQPWATLVVEGVLTALVRAVPTSKRGRVAVVARGVDGTALVDAQPPGPEEFPQPAILGSVRIAECLRIPRSEALRELAALYGSAYASFYPRHYIPNKPIVYIWFFIEPKKLRRPVKIDIAWNMVWTSIHPMSTAGQAEFGMILQEPWAQLVVGGKIPALIRSFPTRKRGLVAVVARGFDKTASGNGPPQAKRRRRVPTIVGQVDIIDCVKVARADVSEELVRRYGKKIAASYPSHYIPKRPVLYLWILGTPRRLARPRRVPITSNLFMAPLSDSRIYAPVREVDSIDRHRERKSRNAAKGRTR